MKEFIEKVKSFIWQHGLLIAIISLACLVVSCTLIGLLDADPHWYILAFILGAPVCILFLFLIGLLFYFWTALIKDWINNRKRK